MGGDDVVVRDKATVTLAWMLAALLRERDRLEREVASEQLSPEVAALMKWVDGTETPSDDQPC